MYTVVLMIAMSGSGDVPAGGHGCNGCCGGYGNCYGGYGGCYGGGCCGGYYGGYRSGHGCHGGYYGGCNGGWGYGCCGGGTVPMAAPMTPKGPVPMPEPITPKAPGGAASAPVPATIFVSLPSDAKLTIDGAPTASTSTRRLFVSPPLPPGQDYVYVFSAQVVRDSQPVTVSKRVTVRAGQQSNVQLEVPAVAVGGQ